MIVDELSDGFLVWLYSQQQMRQSAECVHVIGNAIDALA
jgi:hypothetical protein